MSDYKIIKERADNSFKRQEFNEAEMSYTEALNLVPQGNKEDKRNMLSNRSAARIYLAKYGEALTDADECIKTDDSWFRGYSRRGDALNKNGDFNGAIAAYNSALEKNTDKSETNSTNIDLKKKLKSATESQAQNSWSAKAPYYLKCTIFISALLYMVPFTGGFSGKMYKLFVFSAMASCVTNVIKKHGMIEPNVAYLQKIVPDPNTQRILLCFILFSAKMATFMFMLPVLAAEFATSVPSIGDWARSNQVSLKAQMAPMIEKYAAGRGINIEQLFAFLTPQNIKNLQGEIVKMSCQIEVMCGVFLIIQLILPTRDIMCLFMWWQYLKMRFTFDDRDERPVEKAFIAVDTQLSGYLDHKFCPAILKTGYNKAKEFLKKQAEPPGASSSGAGGGLLSGLTSKCSVM